MKHDTSNVHHQLLLNQVHQLVDEVARTRYANSLLTKTQYFLIACLEYKANRIKVR